jgi:HK97 family phage major capsid protein
VDTDTITIPTTAEELNEFLADPVRAAAVFSPAAVNNGTAKKFLTAHAEIRNARDAELAAQQREQMQAVLGEWLRENGSSVQAPPVSVANGRPQIGRGPVPGSVAARQSLYSKTSLGAQLNGSFETIGDFMRALAQDGAGRQYRDGADLRARLDKVKAVQNAFSTDVASDGGFLVPEEFRSDLLMLALEASQIRSRATVIPMSSQTLALPAVDDQSHASTVFGGIQTYWVDESTQAPETSAKFAQVKLDVKKLMGYCTVPSELPADAPAFGAFIDQALPKALAFEEDYRFMAGSGVGEPLGFINCPAAVIAAGASHLGANTIGVEDLAAMFARMLPSSLMNAIWLADIGTFPQLATMAVQGAIANSSPVWMNNGVIGAPPASIYGRPVYFTEKCPALGTTGDISFIDPSFYLIGDRQAITASASPHVAFNLDKIAYKIIERVDGRPWLQSPLTPKNGGNTLSAFVQLSSTRT